MSVARVLFATLALFSGNSLLAASVDHGCVMSQMKEPSQGLASIDEITIRVRSIFEETDEGVLGWLHTTANRLHLKTREEVVRHDLLFSEGDGVDLDVLAASERRLRGRRYYSDARIFLDPACEDGTRVIVEVKEVWTLEPTIQFSKSGKDSSFGFGLEETNFLGFGTTIALSRFSDDFRTGTLLKYTDPNTGFYNSELDVRLAHNDDGHLRRFSLATPFFNLDSLWAASMTFADVEQDDRLFSQSLELDRYQKQARSSQISVGALIDIKGDRARRLAFGLDWSDQHFQENSFTTDPTRIPNDYKVVMPWVQLQWLEQRFTEMTNLQEMNRIEDINLGFDAHLRLGWSQASPQRLDDRLGFNVGFHQFFLLSPSQTLRVAGSARGLIDVDDISDVRNGVFLGAVSYFWQPELFQSFSQSFVYFSEARALQREGNQDLVVGGDLGARGYPARYQYGDRRQVLTLEQRFFGQREWLSLFYVGSAVFYDMAKIWGNNALNSRNNELLQSIGFGFRVSTNRLGGPDGGGRSTMHIDLAAPIDQQEEIDSSQFSVTVKKSF